MSGGKTAATAPSGAGANRVILWFRNDLRLNDNSIIDAAVKKVQSGAATEVLPVFCFDPCWFAATAHSNGLLKTGPYRAQFLLESVLDLKSRLRSVGSDLLITMGPPEKILSDYAAGQNTIVLAQSEVTSEEIRAEKAVKSALKAKKSKLELYWGSTLFHIDDLPFKDLETLSDMPDVFTPFKQKCEDRSQVRACFPAPKPGSLPLPAIEASALAFQPKGVEELNTVVPQGHPVLVPPIKDPRAAMVFTGGESAALDRLKYYLWDSNLIAEYFNIRNGMLGEAYSTKLAPALAHGCISPRYIYSEIKKYESKRESNKSTYWVIFELIWRDYFKFFALKHGDAIFHLDGTAGRSGSGSSSWSTSTDLLTRWKEGTTGWPLVDANMRELAATGWMSNRGRQNVASFLALDLGIDWRIGADWFESLLLDYDPASNWGNWVAAAGVNGGRVNKFNIAKQSKDYDPTGDYCRHWLPELEKVPASRIHEPWLMSKAEQTTYGVQIGVDYPQAIPASSFAGRNNGGGGRGGGGGGRGGRGGRGGGEGQQSRFSNGSGGKGGSGNGNRRNFRPKSDFEMYG
jgi:deoxyribodipyrimidine photo-lyase